MPIMWCLAHPKIGEREVVAALLEHDQHLIRDGQLMLADKGFSGKDFAATTAAHGSELLRPDRKDETYRNGNLGGVRQWIESVNQTLKGQLDLEQHGGRTTHGVFTRVAQRLLAMAAGIWRNWATGVQAKRSLTAYDHRPSRNHPSRCSCCFAPSPEVQWHLTTRRGDRVERLFARLWELTVRDLRIHTQVVEWPREDRRGDRPHAGAVRRRTAVVAALTSRDGADDHPHEKDHPRDAHPDTSAPAR
jgi:hypothetical protein